MKKDEFLAEKSVSDFTWFLAETLPNLRVNLNIRKSAKVPGGVNTSVFGLPEVLNEYRWNSGYVAASGTKIVSSDWRSTKHLLTELSLSLKLSCASGNDDEAQRVATQILQWGGDRNKKVGATIDIQNLVLSNQLTSYLNKTKVIFAGQTLEAEMLSQVRYTGSMWTKIYALNSDDGLPIYDSRVAMGMVGLVHLFYKHRKVDSGGGEQLLSFNVPTGTNWDRNKKNGIPLKGITRINKDDAVWSTDTLKLSWIMDAVLDCSNLFSEQGDLKSRKHGFEASLFLLGYDLNAIFR
ncbi:hypothetical protein OAW29_00230 [Planktomarina temperata]|nr:hypothetical protein [Planktomarina temperata]